MNELEKVKDYLMNRVEWYTQLASSSRTDGKTDTAYHFECHRQAIIEVLDFVTDEINNMKGGK